MAEHIIYQRALAACRCLSHKRQLLQAYRIWPRLRVQGGHSRALPNSSYLSLLNSLPQAVVQPRVESSHCRCCGCCCWCPDCC